MSAPDEETIAACLADAFIAAPGTKLRREDHQKVRELAGFLREVAQALGQPRRVPAAKPFVLVDAAAGKCALGLLAAKLLFVPVNRPVRVVIVERDEDRLRAAREAAERLAFPGFVEIDFVKEDLGEPRVFPPAPGLVVALHACGPASDAVIERSLEAEARKLLLAPCCLGEDVPFFAAAARLHEAWSLPRHAPVRLRFIRALVEAERTLRLEAAGYETEVIPFVAPTVTPENLVWRARRVGEPRRRQDAAQRLAHLHAGALAPFAALSLPG